MKKTTKGSIPKKTERKLSPEELKSQLLSGPEQIINQKLTDENLDKENLRQFIADYKEANPVRMYVKKDLKPYLKLFPLEFYKQIYRLRGWPTDGKKLYRRPSIVGAWTNEIIYFRFPPEVLAELRTLNPYSTPGTRLYKHFQLLTEIGELEIKQFISDAIVMMKKATYWSQFKRMMAKEYGLPFQGDLFDKD